MRRFVRVFAAVTAAVCCALPASAAFDPNTKTDGFVSETSEDGFTLGYYNHGINETERAETEKLYEQRPKSDRQYEYLTRGLVAVPGDGGTLVSWRFLGTDSEDLKFNLYRNGEKINSVPISLTNYFDADAPSGAEYTLAEVENGEENGTKTTVTAWDKAYKSVPIEQREGYTIEDTAVGDLDGDGEYEFVVRRGCSMDVETRETYPLIEAYKSDGTHLWTIDIGPNEICDVDINMLVYDFDGDGKAEVVMRSFEGTTDGTGSQIGDTNNDGITDYSKDSSNLAIFKDRQYIVSTPEFLSVYDGETGEEEARTELLPEKEPLSEWSYRYTDTGRLTKRASHYLFGAAYLNGTTPSIVMVRGAWDNVRAAAWSYKDGQLTVDWECDTPNVENVDSIWGACNHNLSVADVDFDGKDEIISGPMAIDDDGTEMYAVKENDASGTAVKLAHGDAFDLAKMSPSYNGYLVWACHETSAIPGNIELHDGRTGTGIFGFSKNKDTGRSRAGDIDPTYEGFEVWGSTGTVPMNISGEEITDKAWNGFSFRNADGSAVKTETQTADGTTSSEDMTSSLPMNFKVYWDGDLLSEFLDGTTVSKWNWDDDAVDIMFEADGCGSLGGTKAVPCISADLTGDWREEIVWKSSDETELRIYSTAIKTAYKIPTLMQDPYYRSSIAVQNNHYNQPPNVSYYLGAETTTVPMFEGYVVHDGKTYKNPDLTASHGEYSIGGGEQAADTVELVVGASNAYVDKEMVKIDPDDENVVPEIVNDRTLVPVRFIAESFGMDVSWDEGTRNVTLSGGGYEVSMTIDSSEYTVNGQKMTLDVPAQIYNSRTLIPLRAMAEAIGKTVYWDDGYIYIGTTALKDTSGIEKTKGYLTSGTEPTPSPTAAPTPTPTAAPTAEPVTLTSEAYTDSDGKTWKMYVNEDFESYDIGDSAGWAGTKPAPLASIGVASSGGSKVMSISGSDKGNRNAVYNAPAAMTGVVRIELDWNPGACTGGSSYGELRFADSNKKAFLGFKSSEGQPIQVSTGGEISNKAGLLETEPWQTVGNFVNTKVHIEITADFNTKKAKYVLSNSGTKSSGELTFTDAVDFSAIEVLAVRVEKNFTWSTEIDNLKICTE